MFKNLLLFRNINNQINNIMSVDEKSTGLNVISFLIPLVGLIIYLTQKDTHPIKAKSAGKSALWGVGVGVALGILFTIIGGVMVASVL